MAKKIRIAEDALVSMLSERNTEGIEILYDNYSSALYGVIFRIVQSDEIAENVLQETFLKIWNNFARYDEAKGRLFSWMVSIARNMALDVVRSKDFNQARKNHTIDGSVSFVDSAFRTTYNPETIGLKDLVTRLDPEYRQVIELLFFGGYTQSEAAAKLDIPLGTVKTRSRAALLKLRQQFDGVKTN